MSDGLTRLAAVGGWLWRRFCPRLRFCIIHSVNSFSSLIWATDMVCLMVFPFDPCSRCFALLFPLIQLCSVLFCSFDLVYFRDSFHTLYCLSWRAACRPASRLFTQPLFFILLFSFLGGGSFFVDVAWYMPACLPACLPAAALFALDAFIFAFCIYLFRCLFVCLFVFNDHVTFQLNS